jgi:hypothetical protein
MFYSKESFADGTAKLRKKQRFHTFGSNVKVLYKTAEFFLDLKIDPRVKVTYIHTTHALSPKG